MSERQVERERGRRSLAATTVVVIAYAIAMGYLEAAVVVYLRRALGIDPAALFPLHDDGGLLALGPIELGRELATLVMLAAVGWLTGAGRIEQLAWAAVAFGTWDIAYYGWLWVFVGWPPSATTWDILFLLPVPWVGPVWAPVAVSATLIGFGLLTARRLRAGGTVTIGPGQVASGLAGGVLVILSFTLDAGNILAGGIPKAWAWPLFVAGMALALLAAGTALRPPRRGPA